MFSIVSNGYQDDPLTEPEVEILKKVTELLRKVRVMFEESSTDEVLQLPASVADVQYVLPRFSGKVFEHLRRLKCRIYGAPAIIQSLTTGKRMIPRSEHPMFCTYLLKRNISYTGIDADEREDLCSKIWFMGGYPSGNMNDKTNVLLARSCDTDSMKYQWAMKKKIKTLLPEMVEEYWQHACTLALEPSEELLNRDFNVPIFSDCVITVSGINPIERKNVADLVESHGGTFSGEMKRNVCTHLIINSTTGKKYKCAIEWGNIKVVTMKWLMNCAHKNVRLREEKWHPGLKTSTQNPDASNATLNDLGISSINSSRSHMHNLTGTSTPSNAVAQTMSTSSANLVSAIVNPLKVPSRQNSFYRSNSIASQRVLDPVEEFDFDVIANAMGCYLEHCRIYFYELRAEQKTYFHKLANLTGCAIQKSVTPELTHVVVPVGVTANDKLNELRNIYSTGAEVVTSKWLIACVQQNEMVDPTEFTYPGVGFDEPCEFAEPTHDEPFQCSSNVVKKKGFGEKQNAVDVVPSFEVVANTSTAKEATQVQHPSATPAVETARKSIESQLPPVDQSFASPQGPIHLSTTTDAVAEVDVSSPSTSRHGCAPQESPTDVAKTVDSPKPAPESPKPSTNADVADDERVTENTPPRKSVGDNYGLDLSYPLEEYLSGDRQFKLKLPFADMIAEIDSRAAPDPPESEADDSFNASVLMNKMVQNMCSTSYIDMLESEAAPKRDWHDLTIYKKATTTESANERNLISFNDSTNGVQDAEKNGTATSAHEDDPEKSGHGKGADSSPDDTSMRKKSSVSESLLKALNEMSSKSGTKKNEHNLKPSTSSTENDSCDISKLSSDNDSDQIPRARVNWDTHFSTQELRHIEKKSLEKRRSNPLLPLMNDPFETDSADPFDGDAGTNTIVLGKVPLKPAPPAPPKKAPSPKAATLEDSFDETLEFVPPPDEVFDDPPEATTNDCQNVAEDDGNPAQTNQNPPEEEGGKEDSSFTDNIADLEAECEEQRKEPENECRIPLETVADTVDDGPPAEDSIIEIPVDAAAASPSDKAKEAQNGDDGVFVAPRPPSVQVVSPVAAEVQPPAPITTRSQKRKTASIDSPKTSEPAPKKDRRSSTASTHASLAPSSMSTRSSSRRKSSAAHNASLNESDVTSHEHDESSVSRHKHVLFSGFDAKESENLVEQISNLNGSRLDRTMDFSLVDVLVIDQLKPSEKVMISLAVGAFVVSRRYVIDSSRKGNWLDPELYEHGNLKSVTRRVVQDNSAGEQLASAAYKWRCHRVSTCNGAFYKWNVLLFVESSRSGMLASIIKAGGGKARNFTEVNRSGYKNFSHCIVGAKTIGGITPELTEVMRAGVTLYKEMLILKYLRHGIYNSKEPLKNSVHELQIELEHKAQHEKRKLEEKKSRR